ncbi:iron chaperone [Taibaiella koreensis]|uniref:iron chaperone n=1 Tax=Taibaiella koreensis TaxID=1268548 RepID=UPI000E59D71A|nr:DUF1801 domain-containing protein [Taibaiella koreensis]
MATKPETIDEYIAGFPEAVQAILQKIRATIMRALPEAEETISYAIPAFKLEHGFIYFAGYKHHVSIYPAPREHEAFKAALAGYKGGKGTVQFPLDQPVPYPLIARIATFRMQAAREKAAHKKATKA